MNLVPNSGKRESQPAKVKAPNDNTLVEREPACQREVVTLSAFEACVEKSTGKSMSYLRDTPIDEQRRAGEIKRGRRVSLKSYFPFIGRGSVLHGRLVSHDAAEAAYLASIKHG